MIPRSRWVAVLALLGAGALHAAVAVWPGGGADIARIDGGGARVAIEGDSFADMAERLMPVPPPAPAGKVAGPTRARPAERAAPRHSARLAPVPAAALSPTPGRLAALVPEPAATPPADPAAAPETDPVGSAIIPTPDRARAPAGPDRLEPEMRDAAPLTSARPRARPDRTAPREAAQPPARAGSATARPEAVARQEGRKAPAAAGPGNAAAANYPGQVMQRIHRTRREAVAARGVAQVRFTVAANGSLASLVVARSSGSARLDQAALRQIRQAAPFPPPPEGAQRSFSLEIRGR